MPVLERLSEWAKIQDDWMTAVYIFLDRLIFLDQRATDFQTLMTAKVNDQEQQGIFVSIPAARLEYFNKLVISLVCTMDNKEEFDRLFDLLERLIALELGEVDNVTEKAGEEKVGSFEMAFWLLAHQIR